MIGRPLPLDVHQRHHFERFDSRSPISNVLCFDYPALAVVTLAPGFRLGAALRVQDTITSRTRVQFQR